MTSSSIYPRSEPPGDPYTVNQIAELLNVDTTTVRYWIRKGHLPATKTGHNWAVERDLVDEMVATHTTPARKYQRKNQTPAPPPPPPPTTKPQRPGRTIADTIGPDR